MAKTNKRVKIKDSNIIMYEDKPIHVERYNKIKAYAEEHGIPWLSAMWKMVDSFKLSPSPMTIRVYVDKNQKFVCEEIKEGG